MEISSVKNSVQSTNPTEGMEAHATRLEDGWMESEWFGTFLPYTENWIFHFQMGWLYILTLPMN